MSTTTDDDGVKAGPTTGRDLKRVLLGTAALLLVPLVAMRFTSEVHWTIRDFLVAGMLLAGTGTAWVLAASRLRGTFWRRMAGGALLSFLLLAWAELAVGLFGTPFAGS